MGHQSNIHSIIIGFIIAKLRCMVSFKGGYTHYKTTSKQPIKQLIDPQVRQRRAVRSSAEASEHANRTSANQTSV